MKQLVFGLMLAFFLTAPQAGMLKPYKGPLQQPSLALKDLQGHMHKLSDYKGQVVLVQFWATYCVPCRTEMPSMNRLQAGLADRPFKILAVDMAEETAEVEAFVKQVKPAFTILLDEDGTTLQRWKVFAAPASFIIGPDGEIKYTLYGGVEWDAAEIVDTLKSLM